MYEFAPDEETVFTKQNHNSTDSQEHSGLPTARRQPKR